jgi:glutathione synthase/RimK-type ligase-like ATP-grasp enzyme
MHATAPFLVVHHKSRYRGFYDVVLEWISLNLPGQRELFELRTLPWTLPEDHGHALMIPWLQDPVEQWCPRTYDQARKLTGECDRRKVVVVNRPERLSRAGKLSGARLMSEAGLRTPRVARIEDPEKFRKDFLGFSFPFFVREDCGHGGKMIRADTPEQARAVRLHRFKEPVAIQLIDLPDAQDGFYRKYRYVVAGDFGAPHHLQVSTQWITRGGNRVINETTRVQEIAYIETPCLHHDSFQRARRALGLDFVAFDYSLDSDGAPVVWEANPYPYLHFSRKELTYRNEAMHRTLAILVAFYFQRANLPLPSKLAEYLNASPAVAFAKSNFRSDVPVDYWQIPPAKERLALKRAADGVRDSLRRLRKQLSGIGRLANSVR